MRTYYTYNNNKTTLHLGSLKSKYARFSLHIVKKAMQELNIKNLQNKKILLAVSGGVDSIAMLGIFIASQQYFGYNLHICHYNHCIRKESIEEEKLIQKLCTHFNLSYSIGHGDVPHYAKEKKIGLEEAGRILRYAFFANCMQEQKALCICTAHHAQDLCEDILMRLIRGTSWPKLAGMPSYDPKRKLLRPLLSTQKQELIEFVTEISLPFAQDTSNFDLSFQRNRIRHTILPLFEKENPQFYKNILKLKENANYDTILFNKALTPLIQLIKQNNQELLIPIMELQKQEKTIRLHFYYYLLEKLGQGHANNDNFERLDTAVMQHHGNTEFKFSHNVRIKIKNSFLIAFIKTTV